MALALKRDTDEWLEARRSFITSTAIPIILGLSPYRCEADLAAEMDGATEPAPDPKRERLFRLGHALEPVIRAEDEAEHGIRIRRVNRFIVSPDIPWAATSLDFERVGERCIVEAKSTRSRRVDDGLPQDWEAQVRWQMGVAGYPRAHVAVLRSGSELECFDVEHDPDVFAGLVDVAADFMRRRQLGGPFSQTLDSLRRRYPEDDGTEMEADDDLETAVAALAAIRRTAEDISTKADALEIAIKTRMGEAARLRGRGWRITWKRGKDRTETDWKLLSAGLLRALPEDEQAVLIGLHSEVKPGARPFRLYLEKGDAE